MIVYNAISVDGRNTGFKVDMGAYYGLASNWKEDITLVGSGTILSAPMEPYEETEDDFKPVKIEKDDTRGAMAVVDSVGKVRIWSALRKSGYWKDFIALVSERTPAEYLDYLDKRHVSWIKVGKDKVDLRVALEELDRRGFETVRVDAGGMLNSLLLDQGLADEVCVLIHPALAGESGKPFYASSASVNLKLVECKQLEGNLVWLRYAVH
ncbi:dihydrofolate reductase family protein [candidate division WOR-3 bacterium]|nr:dihydrofolate reductase family protein [candidate division WOR-3 bacterium]